jgi:hypothetical protein
MARCTAFLLTDRRALAVMTLAYVIAGFVMLHYDYALNDEGLIIHYTGTWARLDLPAVFYLQKAKPVLSVLYALPSLGGVLITMMAHLLVSAAALPCIAGFARHLGYQFPNLPALALGFSPIFFLGGAAGIANNDAIVGTALVLWLLGRGQPLTSGLVLGCLPWVRAEMIPLVGILWLHGLFIERNPRFLIGTMAFPLAYALSGAAYHRDLLWLIHYPPSSPFNPNNPMWWGLPIGPEYFLAFVPAVTPVMGLAAMVRLSRLSPLERTLFVYLVVMTLVLEIFPIFKIGNFGGSPRYLSQLLPVFALLAARAVEIPRESFWARLAQGTLAVVLTAWAVTRIAGSVHVVPVMTLFGLTIACICLGGRHAAAIAATVLIMAGPLLVPGSKVARQDLAAYLDPMEQWLHTHRDTLQGPIYTNSQLLEAFTQLHGGLPSLDIRYLIGFDQLEGTLDLSNPYNGQRESIRRLCARSFYGRGLVASELRPEDLTPGTLFAIRVDKRTDITLPPEIWASRLEILHEEGGARMARLRPAPVPP